MTTELSVFSGPVRICRECKKPRSLDNYELQDGEVGYYGPEFASAICYPCRTRIVGYIHGDSRRTAADERRNSALRSLMQKLRGEGLVNAPHIKEFAHEVFGSLGGVKRVAGDFKRTYESVMTGMDTRKKMDMLRTLQKLSEASTEHNDSAPDAGQLTDQELALALQRELQREIDENDGLLEHIPDNEQSVAS